MTEYARSGVNIDAKKALIERIRGAVHSTHGENVLAGVGAFGGMFQVGGEGWPAQPVLVASTDGVGTKTMLAAQVGRFHGLGHDIVNHCVNDILCQGARPLFFMDYIASSRLDPEAIAALIEGIAEACRAVGCALLGGETAEMPGVYQPGHFDLVGSIVGVTDQRAVLPSPAIRPGDVLIGFESSGPHTNGYSLIRRAFANVPLETAFDDIGVLGDALLAPHASYLNLVTALRQVVPIKALAHITGGGFFENIPRVLPDGCGVELDRSAWNVPPLFALIQERGQVKDEEMYRVFNMGIGMVAILDRSDAENMKFSAQGVVGPLGQVVEGSGVRLL